MHKETTKRLRPQTSGLTTSSLVTAEKVGIETTTYVRNTSSIIKEKNSPITSRRSFRAAAEACGPQDISFQDGSILDSNPS